MIIMYSNTQNYKSVEQALVKHYLEGYGELRSFDTSTDELKLVFSSIKYFKENEDNNTSLHPVTFFLVQACGSPKEIRRVLQWGQSPTLEIENCPGYFRYLILSCHAAYLAGLEESKNYEEKLRQICSSSGPIVDGLNTLWEKLATWTREHSSCRKLILPTVTDSRTRIGQTQALTFPIWRDSSKFRSITGINISRLALSQDEEVRCEISRDEKLRLEHEIVERANRIEAKFDVFSPAFCDAWTEYKSLPNHKKAFRLRHRFWRLFGAQRPLAVTDKDSVGLQLRTGLRCEEISLLFTSRSKEDDKYLEVESQSLPLALSPHDSRLGSLLRALENQEPWARVLLHDKVATFFLIDEWRADLIATAISGGALLFHQSCKASCDLHSNFCTTSIPGGWKIVEWLEHDDMNTALGLLMAHCPTFQVELADGGSFTPLSVICPARRHNEFLASQFFRPRFLAKVDGILEFTITHGCIPKIKNNITAKQETNPAAACLSPTYCHAGDIIPLPDELCHIHNPRQLGVKYQFSLGDETARYTGNYTICNTATVHSRLSPSDKSRWQALTPLNDGTVSLDTGENDFQFGMSLTGTLGPRTDFEHLLEAVYLGGRGGWSSFELVNLISNILDKNNNLAWDALLTLEETGWLEALRPRGWGMKKYFLSPPMLYFSGELANRSQGRHILLDGAAPNSVATLFIEAALHAGGCVFCMPGIGSLSPPRYSAIGVDAQTLADNLGWPLAPLVSPMLCKAPYCWRQSVYSTTMSGYTKDLWWDESEGCFSKGRSKNTPALWLARLSPTTRGMPRIYQLENGDIYECKQSAICEAHRRAGRPLFKEQGGHLVRQSREGALPLPIAHFLALSTGINPGLTNTEVQSYAYYASNNQLRKLAELLPGLILLQNEPAPVQRFHQENTFARHRAGWRYQYRGRI